jgi:hypothetical protein
MKVKLTKLSSTHQNLRTDTIEGNADLLPEVGQCFAMTAEPLDPRASFRWVRTTPIQSIEAMGDTYRFTTENSTYQLEVLR